MLSLERQSNSTVRAYVTLVAFSFPEIVFNVYNGLSFYSCTPKSI